jgi:hypothetical protein
MDKTVRKYTSLDEMKADEYRYWQSRPVQVRMDAVEEMIRTAQPRFTKDIDFFIGADPPNAQATYAALAEFGAAMEGIRPEDFADRGAFFRFGRDPRGFDIAAEIASGRPQDLADVSAI